MEAGGHYYTVYYTSLAVGYKQEIAYRHAVLAQMPDQVGWLDAAHMQVQEAKIGGRETDLGGISRVVTTHERAKIQAGLHSLVPNHLTKEKASAFQRRFTVERLMEQSPTSLKFGLLLHRLGDSFAHSRIDDHSKMYGISSNSLFTWTNFGESAGHLFDMHDPDYPFLRTKDIFFPYLQQLYNVLFNKLNEKNNLQYKRPGYTPVSFGQLKSVFEHVFSNLVTRQKQFGQTHYSSYSKRGVTVKLPKTADNDEITRWFILEMRSALGRIKDVKIETYAPEQRQLQSLRQFLNDHRELSDLDIQAVDLNDAITDMIPGGEDSLIPAPEKSLTEKATDYLNNTDFVRGMNAEIRRMTMPPGYR